MNASRSTKKNAVLNQLPPTKRAEVIWKRIARRRAKAANAVRYSLTPKGWDLVNGKKD